MAAYGVDSTISVIKAEIGKMTFGRITEDRIKNLVKYQISERLSSGALSEDGAKEVKNFFDYNMREAIVRKDYFESLQKWAIDNGHMLVNSREDYINKILKDTGLTYDTLIEAAKLAGDDLVINKSKLTRAEKKAGKEGAETRSELHNIQNFLNKKIKENGGTKELSKNDVLEIMEETIGIYDGTYNKGLKGMLRATAIWATVVPVAASIITNANPSTMRHIFMGRKNEKAYGEQTGSGNGSVTNELEAKMRKFDVEY